MQKGRIIIVGGASGIGLCTAEHLLSGHYSVEILDVNVRNERVSDELVHRRLDILDESSVRQVIYSIAGETDRIDGLVYTAGITSRRKSIEDFDKKEWVKVLSTNVTGVLLCLKYAFPLLRNANGRIVVVGSVAARMGTRLSGLEYTISKTALSGLVKQVALDWAPLGILINAVHPSMTATPMLFKNVTPDVIRDIEQRIPLGRIALPEEIAEVIEFLISAKNTYITGSGIDINGGLFPTA